MAICGLRFADYIFFAICGFAICGLNFFADLRLQQIRKNIIFLLFIAILMEVKKNFLRKTNANLDQKHCFFPYICANLRFADWDTNETCGFINTNLWICNLRISKPQKFANCRLRKEPRICGFAMCGLTTKFACPPLAHT